MSSQATTASDQVLDRLKALPRLDRHILLMRERQGMSYDQISAALDVSCELVASRLAAARKSLLRNLHRSQAPFAASPSWRTDQL